MATLGAAVVTLVFADKSEIITITTGPGPTSTVTVTQTVSAPPVSGTNTTNPSSLSALFSVRRTSGTNPITLNSGYGADLDDISSPNWLVHSGPAGSTAGAGSDVSWGYGGLDPFWHWKVDAALVTGSDYSTCAGATGYSDQDIPYEDVKAGQMFCIRTDRNRYVLIHIQDVSKSQVTFDVTAWDPPFKS